MIKPIIAPHIASLYGPSYIQAFSKLGAKRTQVIWRYNEGQLQKTDEMINIRKTAGYTVAREPIRPIFMCKSINLGL